MARTGRPSLSHDQTSELWRRWKAGETLSDIGRALGCQVEQVAMRRQHHPVQRQQRIADGETGAGAGNLEMFASCQQRIPATAPFIQIPHQQGRTPLQLRDLVDQRPQTTPDARSQCAKAALQSPYP